MAALDLKIVVGEDALDRVSEEGKVPVAPVVREPFVKAESDVRDDGFERRCFVKPLTKRLHMLPVTPSDRCHVDLLTAVEPPQDRVHRAAGGLGDMFKNKQVLGRWHADKSSK